LVAGQNLVVVEAAETCLQRQTTPGLRVSHRQNVPENIHAGSRKLSTD